jgi:hypothetical protein
MLTFEEKQKMIDYRIKEYEVRIFDLTMNRTALEAVNDFEGIKVIDSRIEGLRKGIEAVRGMLNADSNTNNTTS